MSEIGHPTTGHYYNFWEDDSHVQYIYHRTILQSYHMLNPKWTKVLDINALKLFTTNTATTWVWHGSTLLEQGPNTKDHKSAPDRALIVRSPG